MKFRQLRECNDLLQATEGLYEKEAIIRATLKACEPNERIPAAMMLTGKLSTAREGLTTGIKEAFVAKDLALEGRQSLESIADVAILRAQRCSPPWLVIEVWEKFRRYLQNPDRSNAAKSALINDVLFNMVETEADVPFLLQILCEKVSNGVGDVMVVQALFHGHYNRDDISRVFSLNPDLQFWLASAMNPDFRLNAVRVTPGTPLEPQLCARVDDLAKILIEHKGMTIVQPKLDGMRVHIHAWIGPEAMSEVRLYSRTMKDMTSDYPEIVQAVMALNRTCILDGELVALEADGGIAPFSLLQTRLGRKSGRNAVKVGVALYDVLLLDKHPIMETPYGARMAILDKFVRGNECLRVLGGTHCASIELLHNMVVQAHEDGEEGVVCKDPNSLPEPGARSKAWIKCKPDYLGGDFSDTFDLVVIGYNKGRGRRHGKIGALWVGIRDGDMDQIWPVAKVGTGFTDEDIDWWTKNLGAIEVEHPDMRIGGIVQAQHAPDVDVWVEPKYVIEIGATGGLTRIEKWAGFSLRFPRYIRRREDKMPAQATSTAEVEIP